MSAVATSDQSDPLAAVKRRLERAAWDLQSAADAAEEAIAALAPEEDEGRDDALADLSRAVAAHHEEHHEGPMRWCLHMCKLAEEGL